MSGPAAHLHGRQRGRWEEHADRAAAVRLALGVRGPGPLGREGVEEPHRPGPIDFSLFTDGLRAEREQGITIDVAYRYFATARRKFILADTPGHEQYTRNMATGASTADVAILLVDARHGVRVQSRRHAQIARLLGITDFVLAVNKMDLVDFDRDVFDDICDEFDRILPDAEPAPDSAERAARRQRHHARATGRRGSRAQPLLEFLETVEVDRERRRQAVPLPGAARAAARPRVPRLRRPDRLGHRAAGRRGHRSGRPGGRSRVTRIVTWDGDLEVARVADVGHAHARGRDRHQPRRPHRGRRAAGRAAIPGRRRLDGRAAARSRRACTCSSTRRAP